MFTKMKVFSSRIQKTIYWSDGLIRSTSSFSPKHLLPPAFCSPFFMETKNNASILCTRTSKAAVFFSQKRLILFGRRGS